VSYGTAIAEVARTVVETQIKSRVVEMTNCVLVEQLKKKLETVQLSNSTFKHHIQDISRYKKIKLVL
jgi:hypothetical protein